MRRSITIRAKLDYLASAARIVAHEMGIAREFKRSPNEWVRRQYVSHVRLALDTHRAMMRARRELAALIASE